MIISVLHIHRQLWRPDCACQVLWENWHKSFPCRGSFQVMWGGQFCPVSGLWPWAQMMRLRLTAGLIGGWGTTCSSSTRTSSALLTHSMPPVCPLRDCKLSNLSQINLLSPLCVFGCWTGGASVCWKAVALTNYGWMREALNRTLRP